MKIFIFEYIDKCSNNYHDGGGLVIIAKDTSHAKELIRKEPFIEVTVKEWEKVETFILLGNETPKIWTMPDAGCC